MKWVVGADPFSDRLAVVPRDQALRDVQLIKAVQGADSLGEVRQSALLLPLVKEAYAGRGEDNEPDFDTLPDDTPFDPEEWLGDYWQPLVRLRTAEHAPQSL